jgi:hypothetical protein
MEAAPLEIIGFPLVAVLWLLAGQVRRSLSR